MVGDFGERFLVAMRGYTLYHSTGEATGVSFGEATIFWRCTHECTRFCSSDFPAWGWGVDGFAVAGVAASLGRCGGWQQLVGTGRWQPIARAVVRYIFG